MVNQRKNLLFAIFCLIVWGLSDQSDWLNTYLWISRKISTSHLALSLVSCITQTDFKVCLSHCPCCLSVCSIYRHDKHVCSLYRHDKHVHIAYGLQYIQIIEHGSNNGSLQATMKWHCPPPSLSLSPRVWTSWRMTTVGTGRGRWSSSWSRPTRCRTRPWPPPQGPQSPRAPLHTCPG